MVRRPQAEALDGTSWAADLKEHERTRRRFVHEDFLKGAPVRMDQATIGRQERMFDPLLQRFRDDGVEVQHRAFEEKELAKFMNRALDVQIMRDNAPINIINMESRIAPIDKRAPAPAKEHRTEASKVNFNILSNLATEKHHWAKPEDRPRCPVTPPRCRKVQACRLRDFNIVSNRYLTDHEEKSKRDADLNALEIAHTYRSREYRFDPVQQKFNDPEHEERQRCCADALEAEVVMRKEALEPPTLARRVTKHYDMITHQADDEGVENLKRLDVLEEQRKSHLRGRHMHEHKTKMMEYKREDNGINQRFGCVSHSRWEETTGRGYSIVNNRAYGDGPKDKFEKLYEPFTTPKLTPWETVLQGRSDSRPPSNCQPKCSSSEPVAEQPANMYLPPTGLGASARGSRAATPRAEPTPRTLSEAGSASLGSARGRLPLPASSAKPVSTPPPPPPIPGSPAGSVYSRPKL